MEDYLVQCANPECGHHFTISPGEISTGTACPDCGGKRMFRTQPSPVQSEGTLRDMVDSDSQKDQGGNPLGEGTIMGDGEKAAQFRDNYTHSSVLAALVDEPSSDDESEWHRIQEEEGQRAEQHQRTDPMTKLRCPQCGGEVIADPQSEDLFCQHCDWSAMAHRDEPVGEHHWIPAELAQLHNKLPSEVVDWTHVHPSKFLYNFGPTHQGAAQPCPACGASTSRFPNGAVMCNSWLCGKAWDPSGKEIAKPAQGEIKTAAADLYRVCPKCGEHALATGEAPTVCPHCGEVMNPPPTQQGTLLHHWRTPSELKQPEQRGILQRFFEGKTSVLLRTDSEGNIIGQERADEEGGVTQEPYQSEFRTWQPGQKGRGLTIHGVPHTWSHTWGDMALPVTHSQYVEELGNVDPKDVDWMSGVEISPQGEFSTSNPQYARPYVATDPRLKHIEAPFAYKAHMSFEDHTRPMDPYDSWEHVADVMFDKGPLANIPSHSLQVQPHPDVGVHGSHLHALGFLDASINGVPVRSNGNEVFMKHGLRQSPDFGKPVIVSVHDPKHLPAVAELLQHPDGRSQKMVELAEAIRTGQAPPPPGIDPNSIAPSAPTPEPEYGDEFSGYGDKREPESDFGEREAKTVVCPVCAGKKKTDGKPCSHCHGEGKLEEWGASVLDALESKTAMPYSRGQGWNGEERRETPERRQQEEEEIAETQRRQEEEEERRQGPRRQEGTPATASLPRENCNCPSCQYMRGQGGRLSWRFAGPLAVLAEPLLADAAGGLMGGAMAEGAGAAAGGAAGGGLADAAGAAAQMAPMMHGQQQEEPPREASDVLAAFVEGKGYETPASNPDVGTRHDDPEDVDQKEFNDQDRSPENPLNPNNEDSGKSGEDELHNGDTHGFPPNSKALERMEMLLPLVLHYFHSPESGAKDPLLKGLHDLLEAENPGYTGKGNPQSVTLFMQQHKEHPDEHKASVKEAIVPPMQQAGLPGMQQALDPTALDPTLQPNHTPSSATPPGGGAQMGHCPNCGGALDGTGGCPQCGFTQGNQLTQQQAPMPGGAEAYQSMPQNPGTFGHTDVVSAFMEAANHQGPVTPEQIAAVQQWLIQHGRVHEVPNVELDPGNPEYAKILAEIQNNPNVMPSVKPEEATPVMPPQMNPPGGMPVPGMGQGEPGGQPMQPMASFLPFLAEEDEVQTCANCGWKTHLQDGEANCPKCHHPMNKTAADAVAPVCPECGSHTTGMVGDVDNHAKCHSCHHTWKLENVVNDGSGGSTAISSVTAADDRLGDRPDGQANPVGVPAALQNEPLNTGGDEDSSLTWTDVEGQPIKAHQEYEMHNPSYQIPDIIRVERVKPDGLEVTLLGTYANDPNAMQTQVHISKQDMETQGLSFAPLAQNADDHNNQPPPGTPGDEQLPPQSQETTDEAADQLPTPRSSVQEDNRCPSCGHYASYSELSDVDREIHDCDKCNKSWETKVEVVSGHTDLDLEWIKEDDSFDDFTPRAAGMRTQVASRDLHAVAEKDERLREVHAVLAQRKMERKAGRHFTPGEQRELIDEDGVARNADLLDLEGTHYREIEGKVDPDRVPSDHLFLGV